MADSSIYNFSAGPAVLPAPVLQRARDEMLDWRGCGASVMEMSHRSSEFMSIAERAEADLRELLAIPADYHVLFLQGGASSQFAMVPLNLLRGHGRADYINTGHWSKKAIAEARRFCDVNVAASSQDTNFTSIPPLADWRLSRDAAYVHYTPNETIGGVEFHWMPDIGDKPLAADLSSTILSRPVDVSRFGVIYAGAQKNIGPAGLTVVVARKDLIAESPSDAPTMMSYHAHAAAGSMLNTPPVYAWYIAGLVFEWLKGQGGLEAMRERNARKATRLYRAIDDSDFYRNPVEPASRSWMNVPFTLVDDTLDKRFLREAADNGLQNLKGHRSVGGMRASIYNAMPEDGVKALTAFMAEFERRNG
ncbi:MAG: 3-phosphoserine/phosphohydroxythreonine transaminase [Gammaproteobacteria bacterium]